MATGIQGARAASTVMALRKLICPARAMAKVNESLTVEGLQHRSDGAACNVRRATTKNTGGAMPSNWNVYHTRGIVLRQAQRLARSGQHDDHTSIVRELEGMDGFEAARVRFEEPATQVQLDRLCTMARVSPRASTGLRRSA